MDRVKSALIRNENNMFGRSDGRIYGVKCSDMKLVSVNTNISSISLT